MVYLEDAVCLGDVAYLDGVVGLDGAVCLGDMACLDGVVGLGGPFGLVCLVDGRARVPGRCRAGEPPR